MPIRCGQLSVGTTVLAVALALVLPATVASAAAQAGAGDDSAKREQVKRHQHDRVKPQRPIYWGAWIGDQLNGEQPPWNMEPLVRFANLTAKTPSLLHFSAPFADCSRSPCDFYEFPAYEMERIRQLGSIPFFSWGSQTIPVPANLRIPHMRLANIAAGAYDGYIRSFAEGARAWGKPFFLRFNWEMNSNWFSWAAAANGNRPRHYIAAWRHVHDIFTEVGATNATWVWCPYAHAKPRFKPLATYYPGGKYVDWTCLDGFNWGRNSVNPQPWRSFDQIFARSYRTLVRRVARDKPVLLAEIASSGPGHAKAVWVRKMFRDLRKKYRRIRGLIWFEQIDRGVNWLIESAPKVTREFRRGVRPAAFRSNEYSDLQEAPIRPPR